MIESRYHAYNYFVTLTYAPEFLPDDDSVHKEDVRKYLKRLRYYCGYLPRHFGCGEYGDESARPHYHLCVFSDKDIFNELMRAWEFGRVEVDTLTPGRCQYCAGYVTKKMTKADDPRLSGRNPEFWFCSRKPALGYNLLYEVAERFATDSVFKEQLLTHVYVPSSIRIGGRYVRLPRYIRDKLKVIWKFYNEEKQAEAKSQKAFRDKEILVALCKNLSRMCGIDIKPTARSYRVCSMSARLDLEKRNARAEQLKTKRKML